MIYFYPRDMTSGCTRESQDFRDLHARLPQGGRAGGRRIARQRRLARQVRAPGSQLPFALLADADEKVCKLFDVIKEKSMYGRKYLGVERSTFLLDGTGVLRQEWRKVKVPGHAEEVLEAAQRL